MCCIVHPTRRILLSSICALMPSPTCVLLFPQTSYRLCVDKEAFLFLCSKHLADRIGERLYQKAPGQTAFMTLVNLSHTMHFNEIKEKFASVLQPSEQGVFVITNPNRHR